MFVSSAASILAIASVPFSSHRYEVDFAPYLLLIACVVAGAGLQTLRSKAVRRIATTGVVILLLYSITANLALAIQGPYDQFVQASPRAYVELARWFSPIERFRPLLNPVLPGSRNISVHPAVRFTQGTIAVSGRFRLAISALRRMRQGRSHRVDFGNFGQESRRALR